MDIFPILWNGPCLNLYSNIGVFLWLTSYAFRQDGMIGLKFFVHLSVLTGNLFPDMITVSEVLPRNYQVPIVPAKIFNPGSLRGWWRPFVLFCIYWRIFLLKRILLLDPLILNVRQSNWRWNVKQPLFSKDTIVSMQAQENLEVTVRIGELRKLLYKISIYKKSVTLLNISSNQI